MAPGVQETDSVQHLIEEAERKAEKLADIGNFDFLDYLEHGGVVMPTDQVTVFTDARTSQRVVDLVRKHDEVLAIALKNAELELGELREARFEEILADTDQSEWTEGDPDEDDDSDYEGIADTPVYRSVELAKIYAGVLEEFPSAEVKEVKEAVAYLEEIHQLEHAIWLTRVIIDLEGQLPADNREMEQSLAHELTAKFQANLDPDAKMTYLNTRRANLMLAACITRIQVPHKGIDQDLSETRMPASVARRFLTTLPQSEVEKLLTAIQMLTTVAVIVEPSVDAGFPGGSADETGERTSESGD